MSNIPWIFCIQNWTNWTR